MKGAFFDEGVLAYDILNCVFSMLKELNTPRVLLGVEAAAKALLGLCSRGFGPPLNNICLKSRRNVAFKGLSGKGWPISFRNRNIRYPFLHCFLSPAVISSTPLPQILHWSQVWAGGVEGGTLLFTFGVKLWGRHNTETTGDFWWIRQSDTQRD